MNTRPKTLPAEPDPLLVNDNSDLIRELTRVHGEAWELDDRNFIRRLNPYWWAALFAAERHVIHDQDEGFFEFGEDGFYVPISEHRLLTDMAFRVLVGLRALETPEDRHRAIPKMADKIRVLRGLSDIREPFHFKRPVVALDNGVVELVKGQAKFQRFSPNFLIRAKASVPYRPGALAPRFESEFLDLMLPDADDRDLFLRQAGLILLGQNPAQRMGILEGDSAAGKTAMINLLVSLVGEDRCVQLRTEHLEKQFELDALRGRTLLLGNDVDAGFLNTEGASTLKGLVSTDLYHPEAKNRRDRRPLRGPFNVLIATNTQLTYRAQGDASAWRRRLIIYHCRRPEGRKRVQNFEGVLLREEGAGIVNLLLEGLVRALDQISATGDLTLSPEQQDRIERLVLRSDPLDAFVTRCLILDEDSDVTSQECLEAYSGFCHSRGWKALHEEQFFKHLAPLITDKFGLTKSNDLIRNSGGKVRMGRGWHRLRIQDEGWVEA